MHASALPTPIKWIKHGFRGPWLFVVLLFCIPPAHADSSYPILAQSIIKYNLKAHKEMVADGEDMGRAGILLMGPELGRTFGLKTVIDEDYTKAKALYEEAQRRFDEAVLAMSTRRKEKNPGIHAERVGQLALAYNRALEAARQHMQAYRLKLSPQTDDRLKPEICTPLLDTLLAHALESASYNLRDGLGAFYNRTQGLPDTHPFLTPENIRFVNHVFNAFVRNAPKAAEDPYDLGRQELSDRSNPGTAWKAVVEYRARTFIDDLDPLIKKWKKGGYPVDPLLFISLMKRESNLDPRAVSFVGAVGLTQIMPDTGKGLGMKHICKPPYFEKAIAFYKKERHLRSRAKSIIKQITDEKMIQKGKTARDLMQKSIDYRIKRTNLLARYRNDVLKGNWDDRLKPELAIRYGYAYLSRMMKQHKGDISLALAAYNAGPHRVKQYDGIPPYSETVSFRNSVMRFYREYLDELAQLSEKAK